MIGIRSIGTSLAAVVAAAGKGETSASVRPGGHPFARTLSIGVRMTGKLLVAADAKGTRRPLFAVVDEGPGLSGELAAACTRLVRIPMAGRIDSLNLAVATALLLYEMRKDQLRL